MGAQVTVGAGHSSQTPRGRFRALADQSGTFSSSTETNLRSSVIGFHLNSLSVRCNCIVSVCAARCRRQTINFNGDELTVITQQIAKSGPLELRRKRLEGPLRRKE